MRTIVEVPSLTGSHVIPAGTEGIVLGTRPGGSCLVDVVLQPQATGQDGDFHQAWLRPGQHVLVDPRRPELPGAETGSGTGDPDAPSRPCVLTCPDSAGLLVGHERGPHSAWTLPMVTTCDHRRLQSDDHCWLNPGGRQRPAAGENDRTVMADRGDGQPWPAPVIIDTWRDCERCRVMHVGYHAGGRRTDR